MSGTGGSSTFTYAQEGDATRWKSRPVLAFVLRALVRVGPIVLAFVVATFVGHSLERGSGAAGLVLWLAMVWVVSVATLVVSDRLLQNLLPLASLLRLSLVFPEEAPSRFRFALRTGTVNQLERRIEEGRLGSTAAGAATTLLTMLTSLRDHDRLTRGHSERVRAYSMLIAERLELPARDRDRLQWGALAHDVGKLAVAPEILRKPARPTETEWGELRRHPEAARLLVEPLRPWLGEWVDAATQHHERWDGLGYPAGLAGTDITLAGRIVAVADAFDTMTSNRSYKPALSMDDGLAELARNAGTQFDPEVVRAFLAVPLRRVRLVAGAFGWLGNLPFLGEASVAGAGAGGGAAVSAGSALVAAAAIVSGTVVPSLDLPGIGDDAGSRWTPVGFEDVERRVAPADQPPVETTVTADEDGAVVVPDGSADSPARPPSTDGSVPPSSVPAADTAPPTTTLGDDTETTTSLAATTTTTQPPQPVASVDDTVVVEDGVVEVIDVLANDGGVPDPSSVTVVDPPDHAWEWAVLPSGLIRYRARSAEDPGFASSDELRYRACDAVGRCDEATVRVTIVDLHPN